ncbi:DUF2478 domain-containing protein [Azonexus hydrophilus]|uniref:DUF2478 domain-containing protein n=1 Tax=Azonexus hydrophilus TaxID=418702 RepID=UPI0003F68DFB|nr:DUF2478 domain-containing protein [Azonexus hydrophilus]
MPLTPAPAIAAIVPPPGTRIDPLLRAFIADLQARGLRVRGLVQEACPESWGCKFSLSDIETGQRYPISQNLGSQSTACSLDAAGIADATQVMRRIAAEGADLAVFNRFSGLEADGEGFADEMLQVMSQGIPVITIVQAANLPAWRHFTGGMACELGATIDEFERWFSRLGAR